MSTPPRTATTNWPLSAKHLFRRPGTDCFFLVIQDRRTPDKPIVCDLVGDPDVDLVGTPLELDHVGEAKAFSLLTNATSIGEFTFQTQIGGTAYTVDTSNPEGLPSHPMIVNGENVETIDPADYNVTFEFNENGKLESVLLVRRGCTVWRRPSAT